MLFRAIYDARPGQVVSGFLLLDAAVPIWGAKKKRRREDFASKKQGVGQRAEDKKQSRSQPRIYADERGSARNLLCVLFLIGPDPRYSVARKLSLPFVVPPLSSALTRYNEEFHFISPRRRKDAEEGRA